MKNLTALQSEARDTLRASYLRDGSTVYVLTTSVSRSGLSRTVRVMVPVASKNTEAQLYIADITHLTANVLGYGVNKDGAITLKGAGMDMRWHLVHELVVALNLELIKATL